MSKRLSVKTVNIGLSKEGLCDSSAALVSSQTLPGQDPSSLKMMKQICQLKLILN